MIYRVRDWSTSYENNRTRDLKRLDWVPIPNRMDGDGYTELLDHPAGASHLGAWLATVQIASRCDPRGTLLRDGGKPHDFASLGRISRIPAAVFAESFPRFIEIGWLESIPNQSATLQEGATIPQGDAGFPQEGDASRARVPEGNGREWKGREHIHSAPRAADMNGIASQRFAEFWERYPRKQRKDSACQLWLSVVTVADEAAVFACLDRYVASDEVARSVVTNPDKWLVEQHHGKWAGDWPAANGKAPRRQSVSDEAIAILQRQEADHGGDR
jgi:hypothetical protein